MNVEARDIDKQSVGFFRFGKINGEYLLTNDVGEYCFLPPQEFNSFLSGRIKVSDKSRYTELQGKYFIRNSLDFLGLASKYSYSRAFLNRGTGLHIVIVTLRCDHNCLYCQAGSKPVSSKGYDMDTATARKVVDAIFQSPGKEITIEFQGGEPLLNWDTVKFIVEYAKNKNKKEQKNLSFVLVSNLTFMDEKKLSYLIDNNVGICTSLDGPEALHNKNRVTLGRGNSHKNTVAWINRIKKIIRNNKNYKYKIDALSTITKFSLSHPKKIVDEYVRLNLSGIHLRPVNPFGVGSNIWQEIKFSASDFLDFYRESLDYIIKLNTEGKDFFERSARIFLTKILKNRDPNFYDLRSPCGAGIGQLAYNFNGDVYTCDEGRMLAVRGDESFKLGNVGKTGYRKMISSDTVKSMGVSSCLDNLPGCHQCVYNPYCGVCPIYNYVTEGNIFSQISANERCKINKGILDYIFLSLKNNKKQEVLKKWVE